MDYHSFLVELAQQDEHDPEILSYYPRLYELTAEQRAWIDAACLNYASRLGNGLSENLDDL